MSKGHFPPGYVGNMSGPTVLEKWHLRLSFCDTSWIFYSKESHEHESEEIFHIMEEGAHFVYFHVRYHHALIGRHNPTSIFQIAIRPR